MAALDYIGCDADPLFANSSSSGCTWAGHPATTTTEPPPPPPEVHLWQTLILLLLQLVSVGCAVGLAVYQSIKDGSKA